MVPEVNSSSMIEGRLSLLRVVKRGKKMKGFEGWVMSEREFTGLSGGGKVPVDSSECMSGGQMLYQ